MQVTKTDLKLLIPFLLFVIVGLWGSYSFPYIENKKALYLTIMWAIVPSLILGYCYAYYSIFKRGREQSQWRKVLGLLAFTLIFTLLFLKSSQGYVVLWNAYIGKQEETIVRGIVNKIDYPRRKKLLNSYAIVITSKNTEQPINLDVPSNKYSIGIPFEKRMRKGSLGILYSH